MEHVRWYDTDHATPTELDSTEVEKTPVKLVCAPFDFGEDFGVVLRETFRRWFATLVCFAGRMSVDVRCRDFFKVWILRHVSRYTDQQHSRKLTSLPKLFCRVSPRIFLLMNFASRPAML